MGKKELHHQMKEILDGKRSPLVHLEDCRIRVDPAMGDEDETFVRYKRKVYLNDSPLRTAERATAGVKELVLCEKCGVYIDHLEHWCGGMALACRGRYTYRGWRHYWKKIFWVWRYSTPLPLRRFR